VSPAIQAKLLRAIEQKEVTRVESQYPRRLRIIAATNQDLKGRVDAKAFARPLLPAERLSHIPVPPLRSAQNIPKLSNTSSPLPEENADRAQGAFPRRENPPPYRWRERPAAAQTP